MPFPRALKGAAKGRSGARGAGAELLHDLQRLGGVAGRRLREPAIGIAAALAVVAVVLVAVLLTRGGEASGTGATVTGIPLEVVTTDAPKFWSNSDPGHAKPATVAGMHGEKALQVELVPGRTTFTFLRHDFAVPQDWSASPFVLLDFKGTGGGGSVQLNVFFDAKGQSYATYTLLDTSASWRQIALSPALLPESHRGDVDWSTVSYLSLSGKKNARALLTFGAIQVANPSK